MRHFRLRGGLDAEVLVLLVLGRAFAEDIPQGILDLELELGPLRLPVGIAFPLQLLHRFDQCTELLETAGHVVEVG
jgi:hypothetical protein